MKKKEFRKRASETEDWAPGWEAIDACLESLYGGQKPSHYGTNLASRAIFGGDQYLDGFSVYESSHGHLHMVTYGMSELYVKEKSLGGEWSGWGYEMTARIPSCEPDDCMWVIEMMAHLARYTFEFDDYLEPLQFMGNRGEPIKEDSDSAITGLLVIEDPELPGINTLYGRVGFLQLVGITQTEVDELEKNRDQVQVLMERMSQDNPYFVTDLARVKSYL